MKILHLAVENFSRIPAILVREERKQGHDSYLATLYPTGRNYTDADYCLNLPLIAKPWMSAAKKWFEPASARITNHRARPGRPIFHRPGIWRSLFYHGRDFLWRSTIEPFLKQIDFYSFDLLILDGGAGFYRHGRVVQKFRSYGGKVIAAYYGSDLRSRGLLREIDKYCAARFSFEYDHRLILPESQFLYFPFSLPEGTSRTPINDGKIRIGHAPTNRAAKGTGQILAELETLKNQFPLEIILIENRPYSEAVNLKSQCDLFIDQIGELGYGVNSLESLAMGIPTAVELLPDFESFLGDHPFINISRGRIAEELTPWLESAARRTELGRISQNWVAKRHNPAQICRQILQSVATEK